MKFISPTLHGIIDYMLCGFFLSIPSIFALTGPFATVCYLLAVGYLIISLLTNMPFGLFGLIPFWVHGGIELVSGFVFIASPWIFDFAHVNGTMRNLFIGIGVAVLLVYLFTRWHPLPEEDISAATA